MRKTFRIVLGCLKGLIGLLGFIFLIMTVINAVKISNGETITILGQFAGTIIILIFCIYLFYSSLTQIRNRRIKYRSLIWTGMIFSFILLVIIISSFITKGIVGSLFQKILGLLIFTIICIDDIIRLINSRVN